MDRFFRLARGYVAENWRAAVAALSIIGALVGLLGYKLGSLVGGLSQAEFTLQQLVASNGISLGQIARDPLFLPYDIALYLVQLSPFHGPTMIRSVGVLFGLLGAIGFFSILRRWYTTRIAWYGTFLFVTSTWFLHSARFASPESSYLLLPLLIASVVALQAKTRAKRIVLAVVIFGFSALYIPGVIWFLLPAIVLQRHTIMASLKSQSTWFRVVLGIVSTAMLVPAVIMLAMPAGDTSALKNLLGILGLPGSIPSLSLIADNASSAVAGIFAVSSAGPLYTLGRLPWLDICTTALVIVGLIQFVRFRKLARSKLIAIIGVVSLVLIALGGVSELVLLPFIYLIAVEGLKRLLGMWLTIFPRNPFARGFGFIVITVLVAGVALYHTTRYFIAWPSTPETRQQFNKLP